MNNEIKIERVGKVVFDYFTNKASHSLIPAKDLMPYFIEAGIFINDHRDGLPIRNLLREIDAKGHLDRFPFIKAEKKKTI